MPRHQVPSKRIASLQRRFQVHRRPNSQIAESRQREGLPRDISGESVIKKLGSRKTAPLHANAIANTKVAGLQVIERDNDPRVAAAVIASPHLPNILHDSSKQNPPS
jgi:hypothetical protein